MSIKMPTPLVTTRPRMKRVRHRSEPERYGGGVELARGRGSDRRVLVKWDDGTQRFHDRAEILPEGRTMKVSKQQLKRIIKEEKLRLGEEVMYGGSHLSEVKEDLMLELRRLDLNEMRAEIYSLIDDLENMVRLG